MKISIIIPTLNAQYSLSILLDSLNNQTIPPEEIIIIDSSSDDDTVKIAISRGAKVIRINREEFDHGATRNLGASGAEGDILVYLTQDARPANEFALEYLIKPFGRNGMVAAAFGRQLPFSDASLFSAHLRLFNYPDSSYVRRIEDRNIYGFKTIFISNSFSAYRRTALEKICWFEKNLIFGEDTHAAARLLLAGYNIAYAADAIVYHSHNYTAFQEFKRYFDIGVFHRSENWILKEFGKTQGEGREYLKSEALYLVKHGKYSLAPAFILRNTLKYLGYHLGLKYPHLPRGLACKISMNRNWWENRP